MTVFEFQRRFPTREEREFILLTMSDDEILEIARSCPTKQGASYYKSFLKKE